MLKAELEREYTKLKGEYADLQQRYDTLLNVQVEVDESSANYIGEEFVARGQYDKVVGRANLILGEIVSEYEVNRHLGGLLMRLKNKLGINLL